ncbi:hypothetical protein DITRI_Ditri15bG0032000 [Diplodiscus trichospermus]
MDINGSTPLHVLRVMDNKTDIDRMYFGEAVTFLKCQGYVISSFMLRVLHLERKEKEVNEILEEIGNNAEVTGLSVHSFFHEDKERDIPLDMKEFLNTVRESHLVVATLVATMTFAAGIAVPGGYNSESGFATLSHNSAFKAFIITDALAFVSSLFAIFLHFFSVYLRKNELQVAIGWIIVAFADLFTAFAMGAMVVAFSTSTYAVLKSSTGVAIATCFIVLTYFPMSIIVPFFLRYLYKQLTF